MTYFKDLVFDVGMHNGDDTAYYLYKGYRVVAIEANPTLIPPAQERFAEEIAAGKLTVVHVGITDNAGEADFFISLKNDVWGSFDRQIAGRAGGFEAVRVPCIPFSEILQQYGVPYYLKIDIEGNDRLCLDALGSELLPAYISIEMSHETGDQDIRRLRDLGYVKFKCVRQNDFRLIALDNIEQQLALQRKRAKGGIAGLAWRVVRRVTRIAQRSRDGRWVFPGGSSGPFGLGLPGDWSPAQEILEIWQRLHDIDAELGTGGLGQWFDIHATVTPPQP
jgi:FkbM family methyltransferase